MLSRFILLLLLAVVSVSPVSAQSRPWKSADGTKSIQGHFVSRNASTVKICLTDGKEIEIDVGKLHPDDANWLRLNHPASEDAAVFDTLNFRDTHDAVLAKLTASKFVELTMPESMISRTGLNGIFRIRQKIGGQTATLYFDWDNTDALKEINVRTAAFPAASFDAKLAPCWKEFIKILTTLHGRPLQAAANINPASVPDGSILSSHLWKLDSGGSATLGVGREGSTYQVVVRFTQEKIQPFTSNAPGKPAGPDIDFSP